MNPLGAIVTDAELRERVARLFAPPSGRLHELYTPPEDGTLATVVPGVLWQALIYPRGSASARVLRVYALDNGNAILERFWTNEVRALHRIAARGHPLLPRLVGAANAKELGLGYLIVDDAGDPLEGDHPRLKHLRGNRLAAVKAFADLCHAVAALHAEGMVHRSISPRVILAPQQSETGALRLDGFQMSAFVAGLLRGSDARTDDGGAAFLPVSLTSVACLAPERLNSLVNGATHGVESFSCDVFGLGMAAIDWLAGPPPDADCEAVILAGKYVESAHLKLIDAAHRRLAAAEVPSELRRLLEQMTSASPSNRIPSALEVSSTLGRIYGSLVAQLELASDAPAPQPSLVYFLFETIRHFYDDGIGRTSPEQPDEGEYADLVTNDLAGSSMAWSPQGFTPWTKGNLDGAERARVVLFGRRCAYFCQYLNDGRRDEDARVLLVKYPCPLHRVRALREAPRQRSVPSVRAMFFDPNRRARPVPQSAPSWKSGVEQVRVEPGGETGSPVSATASWLVGYQEGLLAAEEFAFERVGAAGGQEAGPKPIVLHSKGHARAGIQDDRASAFLEVLRREKLLDAMGDVFESAHERATEAGDTIDFLVADVQGKDVGVRLSFEKMLDVDTVLFKAVENDFRVPGQGRVRPDDRATRVSLERQETAARELVERHDLLAQLREPRGIRLETARVVDDVSTVLARKSPEAALLVSRIMEEEPLFAVQGPPGTGKTFIASHVIRAVLKEDPLSRILVSAQSNPATDNILEALDEKLPPGAHGRPLLLRHTSPEARAKLGSKAVAFTIEEQVVAARKRIVETVSTSGPLSPILKVWRRMAKDQELDAELFSRLPRAANVVFATCIGAGAEVEALRAGPGFDWVVIEEAAHAWLSEIAVPLVQGDRWILIGDHAQLPAHGADEVERVFKRDLEDQITVEVTGSTPSELWHPYLSHFRHLMEVPVPLGHWTSPRAVIEVQRRMAPDIGGLVSSAYYHGKLLTHPDATRPHGIKGGGLGFLAKTALVWLDTSVYGSDAEDSGYTNTVELHLIRTLLSRITSFPSHDPKIPALAILSPYKRQLRLLQKQARNHSDVNDECFHTVDSVQGREAEVVIVSLVRNNLFTSPGKALGFLSAPERANVMVSRARRLLIVVGSLAHFGRFPGTHWGEVTTYFKADRGRFIVDPKTALGFTPTARR